MPDSTELVEVRGSLSDETGMLPLVSMSIDATVDGPAVTTVVRQTFRNVRSVAVEVTYIFPLPDRAGVTDFEAELGGRLVRGTLAERTVARADYDAALAAGHRAAIAEQERPDVFTMRVGNLGPGEEATATLTLVAPVIIDDGVAEYRMPLVVAPRYIPGNELGEDASGAGFAPDTDAVPDASRITPPVLLPGQPNPVELSLTLTLTGEVVAPEAITASLHSVAVVEADAAVQVRLLAGERLDRDVAVHWPAGGEAVVTRAHISVDATDPTSGTYVVQVVPPRNRSRGRRRRDVVILLDRSGSMDGWKMVAARRSAARVIDSLGARDRFSIVAFDNRVETVPELPSGLIAATDANRWHAVQWLSRLDAQGGTEMSEPLARAISHLTPDASAAGTGASRETDRFIVLITDGQVGNEAQLLAQVGAGVAGVRIFALGIDRAVNAGFLRRLAAIGAGRCELIDSEERLDVVMAALHRRIAAPVARDVQVTATAGIELIAADAVPAVTDIFDGAATLLTGRWHSAAGTPTVVALHVSGSDGVIDASVEATRVHESVIAPIWARARLAALQDQADSGAHGTDRTGIAEQMVAISLRHHVLCSQTAFVAVDAAATVNTSGSVQVIQPVELPAGWAAPVAAMSFGAAGPMGLVARSGLDGARQRRSMLAGKMPPPSQAAAASAKVRGIPSPSPSPSLDMLRQAQEPALDLRPYRARIDAVLELITAGSLPEAIEELTLLLEDLESVGAEGELQRELEQLAAALRDGTDAAERAASITQRLDYWMGLPAGR